MPQKSAASSVIERVTDERDAARLALQRFRRLMGRERRILPSDVGLPYEPLTLQAADGQPLVGWLVPGKGADSGALGKHCSVLVLHHYGGQKATTLPYLELFHRAGLESLAIDVRGHGGSVPVVGGTDGSFWALAEDARAGCNLLADRGARRLIILGQSQGGAIAVKVAAERDDVSAIILDSGPAPTMELAIWGLARQMLGQRLSHGVVARASLTVDVLRSSDSSGYVRALWGSLWKLRRRPLLWIHSEGDQVIPRRVAACWYRVCRPRQGGWVSSRVPGEQHVQQPAEGSSVEQAVLGFLQTLA